MRKAFVAVGLGVLIALAVVATADTPTGGGGGLTRVVHDSTLSGSGTTANPLGVTGGIVGDITGVTAGAGLSGGGTSGTPTIDVGAGANITVAADTVALSDNVTIGGSLTSIAGSTNLGWLAWNTITPTGLTGTLNDWAPTGIGTATLVRAATTGATTVTGISGGSTGRILFIQNAGSSNLVLANQSLSSTASLRIITGTGADVTLATDQSASLIYDGTTGRWRMLGAPSSATGITNSAGANVVMKSDGTNAVASTITDNGTTVAINTNKVTVAVASGNTTIAGTLDVTGALSENTVRVLSAVGSGLSKSTNTVNLNLSGASCAAGQAVTAINSTGTGTCSAVGTVTTGSALTLNTLPRASGSSTLVDSGVTDNGSTIVLGRAVSTSSSIGVGSYVDAATYVGAGNFAVYDGANGINFAFNTNATATGKINAKGYQDGITQFRDLEIDDGKGAAIATFTGSSKAAALAGALSVAGNTSLGDASSDTVYITGNAYSVGQSPGSGKPSVSSCGTSPGVFGGSSGFVVTVGSGTVTSCTITFAQAFLDVPSCVMTPKGAPTGVPYFTAVSTTGLSFAQSGTSNMAGEDMHIHCIGASINPASP